MATDRHCTKRLVRVCVADDEIGQRESNSESPRSDMRSPSSAQHLSAQDWRTFCTRCYMQPLCPHSRECTFPCAMARAHDKSNVVFRNCHSDASYHALSNILRRTQRSRSHQRRYFGHRSDAAIATAAVNILIANCGLSFGDFRAWDLIPAIGSMLRLRLRLGLVIAIAAAGSLLWCHPSYPSELRFLAEITFGGLWDQLPCPTLGTALNRSCTSIPASCTKDRSSRIASAWERQPRRPVRNGAGHTHISGRRSGS